jgi:hypothetical protein
MDDDIHQKVLDAIDNMGGEFHRVIPNGNYNNAHYRFRDGNIVSHVCASWILSYTAHIEKIYK